MELLLEKVREKKTGRKGQKQRHTKRMYYLRWTRHERIQHWLLAGSFIVLVFSGFALEYPESWWAWPFITLAPAVDLRGTLHRAAATLNIALALYHLLWLIISPRGRGQFRFMILRKQDFRDMLNMLRYNLGKTTQHPRFGHFTYWEKFEYWALIWGTIIMATTGLMLWFENATLRLVPLKVIELATVIHLYEAILASLSILVWHFYFVIFSPAVYPMNFSMITGYLSREEMLEEHELELSFYENTEPIPTNEPR